MLSLASYLSDPCCLLYEWKCQPSNSMKNLQPQEMNSQTQFEQSVSKMIEDIFSKALIESKVDSKLSEVKLSTYELGNNAPKVIIVSMPNELLIEVKFKHSKLVETLKRKFPGSMVLLRRSGDIEIKKSGNPSAANESILNDLLFPASVTGRSKTVVGKTEMYQNVFLDNSQQFWSNGDLRVLERVLGELFKNEFRIQQFSVAATI